MLRSRDMKVITLSLTQYTRILVHSFVYQFMDVELYEVYIITHIDSTNFQMSVYQIVNAILRYGDR